MRESIATVAKLPVFQFVALGLILFGAYAWLLAPPKAGGADRLIRVTASDVDYMEAAWQARWNRPPTEEELSGLVDQHIREIALYRHAVAMGLDKNDQVVRRMLVNKLQAVTQNLVELNLSPTEAQLRTYYDANRESYRSPDLITFTQIFFDPDRREDRTLEDADELLAELRSREAMPTGAEVAGLGDSFMLQRYYPRKSRLDVRKLFGQGFTETMFELAEGEWHGPILSGYGVHLVNVQRLEPGTLLELAEIRDRVRQDWVDERRKELQELYVDEVLARYEVVIEGDGPGSTGTEPAGEASDSD